MSRAHGPSERIAERLGARPTYPSIAAWLEALRTDLIGFAVDDATVADLIARGRPRLTYGSADDGAAYVAFWTWLASAYPADARLRAACADVMYLCGPEARACEALALFLDAVAQAPMLFVAYAGDFSELPTRCGPDAELAYEVATLSFYTALAARGELEASELEEAIVAVETRFPTQDVRGRLARR